jgi:putative transposase
MIEPEHPRLSVSRQCQLLALPRSTRYHRAKPVPAKTLRLMQQIDELYMQHPFFGARLMVRTLKRLGHAVGRRRVGRLMRAMGLEAIYRKPNLSKANAAHPVYPYLLRGVAVDRPDQVWATDITYIPVRGGHAYLCAVIDWHSRCVLAWALSRRAQGAWHQNLHGRQRPVPGQRLRRATLALGQIRGGLPARLRRPG